MLRDLSVCYGSLIFVYRDCYDKEVKAKSKPKVNPISLTTSKAKKPDQGTYIHPTVRSQPSNGMISY